MTVVIDPADGANNQEQIDKLEEMAIAIAEATGEAAPANSVDNAALKADIKVGSLATLTTTEKASVVGAINEVDGHADTANTSIGTLASLTTTAKTNLVGAVNEVNAGLFKTDANGNITSPVIIPAVALGAERVTDSIMANWDDVNTLTSFDDGSVGEPGTDSLTKEETEKPAGATFSAKLATSDTGIRHYFAQLITNQDDWENFKITVWAKNGTGAGSLAILDRKTGDDGDRIYNFTGASIGTYTAFTGGLTADTITSLSSVAGEIFSFDNLPQSDETSQIYAVYLSPATADQYCYVALPTLQLYERAPVTLFNFTNAVIGANLKAIDTIFIFETTGGTDTQRIELAGDGTLKTDLDSFDFSYKGIRSKAVECTMAGSVPTPTELDTAFGKTAGEVGDGFVGTIQKAGSTETFQVGVYGDAWYYVALTLATAGV